jgi:hypothetical protein
MSIKSARTTPLLKLKKNLAHLNSNNENQLSSLCSLQTRWIVFALIVDPALPAGILQYVQTVALAYKSQRTPKGTYPPAV